MIYASIIVEAVRARPALVFWLAALSQATLWLFLPTLFYSAPPGALADVLAIGHEMRLGTTLGPPLAYWLAEIAFNLAGGRMIGVYLLSQICILVTLWSLFALGRDIVGVRHAVLAVLLLVGVSSLTLATPEFGPALLATPLWSLTLLFSWRAVALERRRAWFPLSLALGLLLVTSYLALPLLLLLGLFFLASRRGRSALLTAGPWLCAVMVAVIVLPYALWLWPQRVPLQAALMQWQAIDLARDGPAWLRLLAIVLVAHFGMILLIALASGWPFDRRRRVPTVEGKRDDVLGLRFIAFVAVAPVLIGTLIYAIYQHEMRLITAAPLVVASGLAAIACADTSVRLHRQRILAFAWLGLLVAPPAIIAIGVTALPRLLPIELRVAQPAESLGAYFSDTFARRTGQPLAIVAGDRRLAGLIALASDSRPRLFIDDQTTPWLTAADIAAHGAVVVWPALDTPGTPPEDINTRFPNLVLEVPRTFERPLQGFAPPLRVGWAVIRPQAAAQ